MILSTVRIQTKPTKISDNLSKSKASLGFLCWFTALISALAGSCHFLALVSKKTARRTSTKHKVHTSYIKKKKTSSLALNQTPRNIIPVLKMAMFFRGIPGRAWQLHPRSIVFRHGGPGLSTTLIQGTMPWGHPQNH